MNELLVVAFVAILVYAATRIPALGDALGRAVRGPGPREPSPPSSDAAASERPGRAHAGR